MKYAHTVDDHHKSHGIRSEVWELVDKGDYTQLVAVEERFRDFSRAYGRKLKGLRVTYMLEVGKVYRERRRVRRRESEIVYFVVRNSGLEYVSEDEADRLAEELGRG